MPMKQLSSSSALCSKHFTADCFIVGMHLQRNGYSIVKVSYARHCSNDTSKVCGLAAPQAYLIYELNNGCKMATTLDKCNEIYAHLN